MERTKRAYGLMLTGWQNVLCTTFIAWPKCPITKHWYHHRLSFFRGCVRGSALLYTRVHQYTSISNLQFNLLLYIRSDVGNFPTIPNQSNAHCRRPRMLTPAFAVLDYILYICSFFVITEELSLLRLNRFCHGDFMVASKWSLHDNISGH